jgi:nitrate/nitrite-specific signal transduction histidine kinase
MTERETVLRVFARGEELLEMLRRGRRFTEELLTENERLRFQLVKVESEKIQLQNSLEGEVARTGQESTQLRRRIEHLEKRFEEVERENHDFAQRYTEVSQENESLANLYVASYRLHSTLDPGEVMEIICEILVELVGAEDFGILLMDERNNELSPVRVEGPVAAYPAHILMGRGPIGAAVSDGRAYYQEGKAEGEPLAVIPLQIKGHSVGALVITRLLHGRTHFDGVAKELLGLLAGHAATSLMSSRLYSNVDRKLRTIEGFMELMKPRPSSAARA